MKFSPYWLMALILMTAGFATSAHACGFHSTIKGGFEISYPGALSLAVAVASARHNGLLPQQSPNPLQNQTRFLGTIADLKQLRSHLEIAHRNSSETAIGTFSFLLIGPGLWSHFYAGTGGILARYHADGPIADKTVILTHPAVLRALLTAELTAKQASQLGLLAYSGSDTRAAQKVFETSF